MFRWRFIKAFPKLALVAGVFVVSTALFAWWWMFGSLEKREQAKIREETKKEIIAEKVVIAENRMGNLFLAGGDLCDVETGAVIFKNWLTGDKPSRLFYDAESKSLLASFPTGLNRYRLDGTMAATLAMRYPVGFTKGFKGALYAKDKNIWMADVDLKELKLTNERQITTMGIFMERFFAENLIMTTEKVLVVQNMNQHLRVNMLNGDVKQTQIPMLNIDKRRSPDGKQLVGEKGNDFYLYDVESEELKRYPIGRKAVTDLQWLDEDRCAVLLAGKTISLFDRKSGKLEELTELPLQAQGMLKPSPDGKFVFCANGKEAVLLNIETKKVERVPVGGQGFVWLTSDSLLFTRDIADSDLRGTWLKTIGKDDQRITTEPYFATRETGALVLQMKSAGQVVFVTRQGICRVKPDGSGFAEVVKTTRPPARLLGIAEWGAE